MSRLSELKKIDAWEVVPGIGGFSGIKITAYRSNEVDKLITDMECEISKIEAERDAYKNKLEKIGLLLEVRKIMNQSN